MEFQNMSRSQHLHNNIIDKMQDGKAKQNGNYEAKWDFRSKMGLAKQNGTFEA